MSGEGRSSTLCLARGDMPADAQYARCTQEKGHDGPHNDFDLLFQWPADDASEITP